MKTMLFNPYTGTPRHPSDIASDPEGILLLDPDEPVKAALTMPYEVAMADELSRMQFWSRVQLLYKEHQAALQTLRSMPAEPVAGRCRFVGTKEWGHCSAQHVQHVLATPSEWPGYEVEYLYATPPTAPVLTEAEIERLIDSVEWSESWKGARIEFARAIERRALAGDTGGEAAK